VTDNRSGNLSIDATRDAENCEPKGWNRCTLNAADRTRLKTPETCTKWDRFPYGTEFVGNGVVPDVKFARTKRDVVMGRDATLETALELASGE